MLTATDRQALGWGAEGAAWTGVIFNGYLDINHIQKAFMYFFLKGKRQCAAWVAGGERDGVL